MCGRARSGATRSQILKILNDMNALNDVSADVDTSLPNIQRTDNIGPGMTMNIAVVDSGKLQIKEMGWGVNMGFKKLFNVRSEDAEIKRVYSSMMQNNQRGLVFLDGYYETLKQGKTNSKYYFTEETEDTLIVPVLQRGYAFSTFTKPADKAIEYIHQRQAVAFDAQQVADWFKPCDKFQARDILHSFNDITICANVV